MSPLISQNMWVSQIKHKSPGLLHVCMSNQISWGKINFWAILFFSLEFSPFPKSLKEQYPVTVHVPNTDFLTECHEFKRCEQSKRALKNLFALRLAEFEAYPKTSQNYRSIIYCTIKFWFGWDQELLALLSLPLAEGPREGKYSNASWGLISPSQLPYKLR